MTFKELAIGDVFVFFGQLERIPSGAARGPWRKVSPRKYTHLYDPVLKNILVGTIHIGVTTQKNLVYRS